MVNTRAGSVAAYRLQHASEPNIRLIRQRLSSATSDVRPKTPTAKRSRCFRLDYQQLLNEEP